MFSRKGEGCGFRFALKVFYFFDSHAFRHFVKPRLVRWLFFWRFAACCLALSSLFAHAATVNVTWNAPTDIPITANSYTATGDSIDFTLNCEPSANELMVIKNTGVPFIQGAFSNLAQGQAVALTYGGITYNFVANYYGGNGNDLVLVFAGTRVLAWGSNLNGQLAGVYPNSISPLPVVVNMDPVSTPFGKTVVQVSAGTSHCLALCSDGTVAAWGSNAAGQLGDNSTTQRLVPVAVSISSTSALFGKTVVALDANGGCSMAICSDGTLVGWGYNGNGQLGDNSTTNRLVPVAVDMSPGSALFGKTVVQVSAGTSHCLALCSDGTVAAWGLNSNGQLGDNTTTRRLIPVAVSTAYGTALFGKTVIAVSAGTHYHSLALCSDGTVAAWGNNPNGELGDNSENNQRLFPVAVNTDSGSALFGKTVVAVAAGYNHSVCLCSDGTVAAWGLNGGRLGDNTTTKSLVPVAVNMASGSAVFGRTVVAVSAGDDHSMALCSDGTVAAWGANSAGQLGDNSTTSPLVPVAVNRSLLTSAERFNSISAGGFSSFAVVSASALPPAPTASTAEISNLTLTSVQLNGIVNARGYDRVVVFKYGTDGVTFPNIVAATPQQLNGINDVAVTAQLTGLTKGTTYYYVVSAASQSATTVSEVQSFTTRTEPTVSLGTATSLTTTSVEVTGAINAKGSDTQVYVDYGPQAGNLTTTVQASPAVASGYGNTPISVVLTNLPQGTVYYRIRGTSLGGVGTSATSSFQVAVLSGLTKTPPNAPPPYQGFILVNIIPTGITSGWRFVGEQEWRLPGVPVGGLTTGNRQIEYRPLPGYLHPLREPVSITSGAAATVVEREYFQGAGAATASLSVTLLPGSLGAAAQWRLLGEGDSAWRASGATLGGLAAGVYLVECRDVSGYTTPRPLSVTVNGGESKIATATYFLADAAVGSQPTVVGFDAVTSPTPNPYTYVGQLRGDSGAGTGFVVRQRVVCTAAHVVFNDGTLSAATGLQWLFQRERGTYEPVPQVPRGSYILTGYSAARTGQTPGTSSAASQNLDVASVWFYEEDAARGGSGGYLASDSTDNEWLLSPRLKTIVGYPLDDIEPANQGRIHATPPMNAAFSRANDRVYLTNDITSRGGNSGGPVMVQYDDGRYFPAAVYLGGSSQTRVRVIDSDVIALFDSAQESSNTGGNSTNGGVSITNTAIKTPDAGALSVVIEPAAARAAGARWRIGTGIVRSSTDSVGFLNPGPYTVEFLEVTGFYKPASYALTIVGGQATTLKISYTPVTVPLAPPPAVIYLALVSGPDGTSGAATLALTKSKSFTLTIRLAASTLRITGKLDAAGKFTGSIPRKGLAPANVTIAFDKNLVPQFSGSLSVDGTDFTFAGGKTPHTTRNLSPATGKYTFVLPRDPAFTDPITQPFGHGYAIGTASKTGGIGIIGALGDGTPFSVSAPLLVDATAPVFVQPYSKRGLLAGTLKFIPGASTTDSKFEGTLDWQKPVATKGLYQSGFSGSIAALGSRWTPPVKGSAALDITNWNLAIGNGVLVPPLTGTATLSTANVFTLTGASGTKLTLASKSGLLSGSFAGANGKPVKFKGALLQSQRIGRGVFALPDKTGPVTLGTL